MKSTDFLNMPTDPIRAALERLVELDAIAATRGGAPDMTAWENAITAARDALAADANPDPADGGEALLALAPLEGDGEPSDKDFLRVAEHAAHIDQDGIFDALEEGYPLELTAIDILEICRTVYRLGRPSAPVPADGEVAELVAWLNNHAAHLRTMEGIGALPETELQERLDRAATLIQQQAAELAALRAPQGGEVV